MVLNGGQLFPSPKEHLAMIFGCHDWRDGTGAFSRQRGAAKLPTMPRVTHPTENGPDPDIKSAQGETLDWSFSKTCSPPAPAPIPVLC